MKFCFWCTRYIDDGAVPYQHRINESQHYFHRECIPKYKMYREMRECRISQLKKEDNGAKQTITQTEENAKSCQCANTVEIKSQSNEKRMEEHQLRAMGVRKEEENT